MDCVAVLWKAMLSCPCVLHTSNSKALFFPGGKDAGTLRSLIKQRKNKPMPAHHLCNDFFLASSVYSFRLPLRRRCLAICDLALSEIFWCPDRLVLINATSGSRLHSLRVVDFEDALLCVLCEQASAIFGLYTVCVRRTYAIHH